MENYAIIYGKKYVSHNVHNLLHLSKDVKKIGPLDNFSAFKYENYMQKLKSKLKSGARPLQQLINRITEEKHIPIKKLCKTYPVVIFDSKLSTHTESVVKYVQFKNFTVKSSEPNNCIELHDGYIMDVIKILVESDNIYFVGHKYIDSKCYYENPVSSTLLGIKEISCQDCSVNHKCGVEDIKRKCLKIKNRSNTCIVIPLAHTFDNHR